MLQSPIDWGSTANLVICTEHLVYIVYVNMAVVQMDDILACQLLNVRTVKQMILE